MLSLVLLFGSVFSSTNNALAVDMMGGDAPVTQDTITAEPTENNGGNDNGNDGSGDDAKDDCYRYIMDLYQC